MKTIYKKSGNKDYCFVCESKSTIGGFKHVCTLFEYGNPYALETATYYYINKTWERYDFQSVCRECVNKLIERAQNAAVSRYKSQNGIKRISSETRKKVENCEEVSHWNVLFESLN